MTDTPARRSQRFYAVLLDNLLVLGSGVVAAIVIPRVARLGIYASDRTNPWAYVAGAIWGLYFLALMIYQAVQLHRRGQTIGKRVTGVKIVLVSNGQNGGAVTNLLMRLVVPTLIGAVPLAGLVFHLVDALFIFREDRRCIHDLIAGTRVVQA